MWVSSVFLDFPMITVLGTIKNYDFVWLNTPAPGVLILLVIKGNGPRFMCINNPPLHSKSTLHFMSSPKISVPLPLSLWERDTHTVTIPVLSICHGRSGEQCSSRTCPLPVQSHDRSRCPPQRHQPQRAVLRGGWAREACSQTQSAVIHVITLTLFQAPVEEYFKDSCFLWFGWTGTSINV